MHEIKIPQQEFMLKMQGGGGLCTRGGVFVGHYGIFFLTKFTDGKKAN